jgi:hypothetical protein
MEEACRDTNRAMGPSPKGLGQYLASPSAGCHVCPRTRVPSTGALFIADYVGASAS